MRKFTYFDVEYANAKNKSICQIGLISEEYINGELINSKKNIYVNPEDGFDDSCIRVHGITRDRVKDEPTFPVVWEEIRTYFTNATVVGHNVAAADLDALVKMLTRYNLDIPELYYICTYELARNEIPSYAVSKYDLGTLCQYFGIERGTAHSAFDDTQACADLLKAISIECSIKIDDIQPKKYYPRVEKEFSLFVADPVIRKAMSEFYGVIRGFSIDNKITKEEFDYLCDWKNEYSIYKRHRDVAEILHVLDNIIMDGVVTNDEIVQLQGVLKEYLDMVATSPITLATQILDGILKGILVDGEITEEECKNLRQWLYDNIYLADHYPFDETIKILDKILEDSIITREEIDYISEKIKQLLDPVNALREQVNSVEGKHVCLSGNFTYGQKSDVEKEIIAKGGIIDSSIKKSTDILMVGNCECQAYANGTYGTKVKKAIEYNQKGCNIKIIKEADFFGN